MKRNRNILSLLAIMLMGLLFGSCSNDQVDDFFKKIVQAPPSSIERDVKGHEQIYAVHAILRMGYKGGMIGVRQMVMTRSQPITPIMWLVRKQCYPLCRRLISHVMMMGR